MLVIVFFVRGGMTISLLSPCLRLLSIDIVDCPESSMRYIPKSQNEYAFTASTFLEALKFRNRI